MNKERDCKCVYQRKDECMVITQMCDPCEESYEAELTLAQAHFEKE